MGEQSPVSASLGQGDPRVQVKSNKGWARNGTRNTANPEWRYSCTSARRDFSLSLFCKVSFIYNLGQLQTAHGALLELLTRLFYSKVYLRLLACAIIYKGTIRYIQEN